MNQTTVALRTSACNARHTSRTRAVAVRTNPPRCSARDHDLEHCADTATGCTTRTRVRAVRRALLASAARSRGRRMNQTTVALRTSACNARHTSRTRAVRSTQEPAGNTPQRDHDREHYADTETGCTTRTGARAVRRAFPEIHRTRPRPRALRGHSDRMHHADACPSRASCLAGLSRTLARPPNEPDDSRAADFGLQRTTHVSHTRDRQFYKVFLDGAALQRRSRAAVQYSR
jgi:hypothetical protein